MKKVIIVFLLISVVSCTEPSKEKGFNSGSVPNNIGYADSVFVANEMDTLR